MESSPHLRTITVFDPNLEIVNLLLPFAFLLTAATELLFFTGPIDAAQTAFWRGIAATVFFNVIHVGLTYTSWLCVPRFAEGIRLGRPALILVGILFFFLFFNAIPVDRLPTPELGSNYIFTLYNILLIWHAVGQTKGLSLLYNRKLMDEGRIKDIDKTSFFKAEAVERSAANWLVVSNGIMLLTLQYVESSWLAASSQGILVFFLIIHAAIVGRIILSVFNLPGSEESHKMLHCCKYLLWIMAPFSFAAAIGLLSIHGIEYALVNLHIVKKSNLERRELRSLTIVAVTVGTLFLGMALLTPSGFGDFVLAGNPDLQKLCAAALALSMALTVIHCYVDRQHFRFSKTRNSWL